jgi:hypothetical protein
VSAHDPKRSWFGGCRRCGATRGRAARRDGGQAQFIVHEPPESTSSLAPLLQWMTAHLNADLSLEKVACRAAMSTRTLSRRFAIRPAPRRCNGC